MSQNTPTSLAGLKLHAVRLAALGAVLGFVLCAGLTPIQEFIWSSTGPLTAQNPSGLLAPLLDGYIALYERSGASLSAYAFYGRMFSPVYGLTLLTLVAVHTYQSAMGRRMERGFRVIAGGLSFGMAGDILAYWGGSSDDFTVVQKVGFGAELLALLVLLVGSVVYGIATLRTGAMSKWIATLLVLGGVAGVPVGLAVGYVPHGVLLPFTLVWAVFGVAHSIRVGREAKQSRLNTNS